MVEREPQQHLLEHRRTFEQRLDQLINRFRAEKRPKRLEQLSHELAHEAVAGRDDVYAIAEALQFLIRQHREAAISGINDIGQYFLTHDFVFKRIIPGIDAKKEGRELFLAFRYIEKNIERLSAQFDDLDPRAVAAIRTIAKIGREYINIHRQKHSELPAAAAEPISVRRSLVYFWWQQGFGRELHKIYQPLLSPAKTTTVLADINIMAETVDRLIEFNHYLADTGGPPVFDPLTQSFGGVSVADLIDTSTDLFDEAQLQESNQMIDQLIENVPPGDYFWRQLLRGLFLTPFIGQGVLRESGIFDTGKIEDAEHIEDLEDIFRRQWLKLVAAWQQHLAEMVLLPGLAEHYQYQTESDLGKESNLPEILENLDIRGVAALGTVAFTGATRAVATRQMFHPEADYQEHLAHAPISRMAREQRPLGTEDEMAIELIQQAKQAIWRNLKERAGNSSNQVELLIQVLKMLFAEGEFSRILSENFVEWIEREFGSSLFEAFRDIKTDMRQVTNSVLSGTHDLAASRWPEDNALVMVQQSQESLAYRLGIANTVWDFPEDQNDEIRFVLFTKHADIALSGGIRLDQQSIHFSSLKLPPEWHHMETAMKMIVAGVLHDLLGRKKKIWREQSEEQLDVGEREGGSTHSIQLPRIWYWTESSKLIKDFLNDEEEQEAEGQAGKRRRPVFVPGYVKRVAYGAKIEALIAEYQKGGHTPERAEELLTAIRDLRDGTDPKGRKLAHPDRSIIDNLPPVFREELLPVQDPDGNFLYTRTFVSPHFNPSLEPEDYDLPSLYNATYRTHGSALAFLEVAIAELSGVQRMG